MKTRIFITATFILFLLGIVAKVGAQSPSLVEGLNMNIGTGNTLLNSGLGNYYGNTVGLQNVVRSPNALAVGSNDTIDASSTSAVTLGAANKVLGIASMGFGCAVKVNGFYSVGIGHHIKVNGTEGSMVIGTGIIGPGNCSDAYLVNGSSNSLAVGFNSAKPTLFVSSSPNDIVHGVINRTGMVAIGDVTPQAKLHIRSDAGEDAGIILVPANPDSENSFVRFRDNAHHITVDSKGGMEVSSGTTNPLEVVSSNMKLSGSLMTLGATDDGQLYLYSGDTHSITMNALPTSYGYSRNTIAPSYAIEFGSNGLLLRTATYTTPRYDLITNWRDAVSVKTDGAITLNGRVGINAENDTKDYALAVDGGVITTKVHIQDVSDWQDRVFYEGYPLMPLDEVGAYVAENKHLPGIPSEAEVKANGYDIAEMQAALLGKIEELTIHMLRQQKEIDSLRSLVTVHYGYDACGNRTSRTLEFSRMDVPDATPGRIIPSSIPQWQASINDSFAGGDAMLFPNPTEGGFFVSLADELPNDIVATLSALDGTILEERTVSNATEEFDLRQRPAGIYLLRLSSERETKVWKVIKRN